MGFDESDMRVWDPRHELGGLEERDVKGATFLLWKGHCSVHQRFRPAHVEAARAEHPGIEIIVHPECAHDVVEMADRVGSTERIQDWVQEAAPGSVLAIGTEIHMVQRLAAQHPDKTIVSLDPLVCPCSTMFRIDGPHLAWVLENLVAGERREPDRRRRRHQRVGQGRARAHARHHLTADTVHAVLRATIRSRRGIERASRYSCALARKPSGGSGSSIRSISRPLRAIALT